MVARGVRAGNDRKSGRQRRAGTRRALGQVGEQVGHGRPLRKLDGESRRTEHGGQAARQADPHLHAPVGAGWLAPLHAGATYHRPARPGGRQRRSANASAAAGRAKR